MNSGTFSLLKQRKFLPIFLTQFFGAFNDNVFKLAMLTLISYHLSISQAQSELYQAIASALFMLPFFLFSATAGQLADKYDMAHLTRIIKIFEIILVLIGGAALYFGSIYLLMIMLTGMGIHSTFFGPIKYAILPVQLHKDQLLGATALVEASTFIAILLGTIFGTLSISGVHTQTIYAIALLGVIAVLGFIASLFILPTESKVKDLVIDWNIIRATKNIFKEVLTNSKIILVILAIAWFWITSVVILTKLPDYINYVLHANNSVFAVFLTLFSIGIALGSLAINRILDGLITIKYVPHAMLLLSLFAFDLYLATPESNDLLSLQTIDQFFSQLKHWRIAFDIFFISFSSGLFVVPLYSYLQVVSINTKRARTIAVNNIVSSFFIVLATILLMVLLHFKVEISLVFAILSLINCAVAFLFWYLFKPHMFCLTVKHMFDADL